MQDYQVEEYQAEVPISEYRRTCIDVQKFLGYCRACRNYGAVWSCPPFGFSPENLWDQYQTLKIYGRKLLLSPELQRKVFVPDELARMSSELLRGEKSKLLKELFCLEQKFRGSRALSAGTCEECLPQECSRKQGIPCRHPERMRYSIEALGGDVVLTASRYLHQQIMWGKDGHFPEYYLLVGGLLLP